MAVALAVVGGLVSAIGSLAQAGAMAAAAEYNQRVAERNARAVTDQTYAEIEDRVREHRRQLGALKTAYAANGLMFEGSPVDVLRDSATELSYDVAKIKFQGKMKAEGYKEEAVLAGMEKKAAKTAGFIGAATGLLTGVTQAFGSSSSGGPGMSLQLV